MLGIKVTIERFTDELQPGWVECRFVDAGGTSHLFEEKLPVVNDESLDEGSAYPRSAVIACRVIGTRVSPDGREVVVADTERPWGIASKMGESRFEVFREQLIEFDHPAE